MTASEKLQQLLDNEKLTERQKNCIVDYNVHKVDEARDLFKRMLKEETDIAFNPLYTGEHRLYTNDYLGGLSESDIITTLYNLLKYKIDDFVVCDGYNGIVDLFDDELLESIIEVEDGESIMSEDELKSEVLKGLADFGMEASDEDLTIIMGNVESWLTFTDCTVSEAVKHTINYEDPWND